METFTPYVAQLRDKKSKKKAGTHVERTDAEWRKIFPRYPSAEDGSGYLKAYQVDESEEYLPALEKYGFCVIKVFSDEDMDATMTEFLEDSNENPKGKQTKKITLDDPSSWEDDNWPASGKFKFSTPCFGQRAFDNRTNPNMYRVFSTIFKEQKLLCSIDKWGVMRGTKNLKFPGHEHEGVTEIDRPDWNYELKMHWDVNPWLHVSERECGVHKHEMYQALVALKDCPEEVGGFLCVPGSTAFLNTWVRENEPLHLTPGVSVQVPPHDPMIKYQQRVPLRKGELVIWNSAQAHANFANTTNHMRVYQFVRQLIACDKCIERDRFASARVMNDPKYTRNVTQMLSKVRLTPLGLRLVGLNSWDDADRPPGIFLPVFQRVRYGPFGEV